MNKLFSILLLTMLSLPVTVWAADTVVAEDARIIKAENTIDEDLPVLNHESIELKQPVDVKKTVKKFGAAMLGVTVSSLAIFILLTIYNRVREKFIYKSGNAEEQTSLETPDNLNSAVRTFLDKTNWKG